MSDDRTDSSPGGPPRDEASESRNLDDGQPTVIDPSTAPTVVERLDQSTSKEVPVLSHLADQIESSEETSSPAPSGPSTLVEPSSASSRITGDFQEQARKLRETWDPPPDAGVAEQLGATFDPDPPARQAESPGEVPDVEPPPQIDSRVLEANAAEAARAAARQARDAVAARENQTSASPEDDRDDHEPDEESIEDKKERMRAYMEADRELDSWRNSKRRGGRLRSLGCLTRVVLILVLLVGFGALIWAWHPWKTEVVTIDARERPGICSPGVEGTRTVEYFTLFGVRLGKSGESTMCLE